MSNKNTVYNVTAKILYELDSVRDLPSTRATLANLRNTTGKPLSQSPSIWPILFENLPEEFLSNYKEPSYEELAIATTLQLYALHQQGKAESVLDTSDQWNNIGTASRNLRVGDNIGSIDRRFNVLVTSTTFTELSHHLRQMIKILKSKGDIKVNYPKLAEDLFWYQMKDGNYIKLNWSREYYKTINKGEKNENK